MYLCSISPPTLAPTIYFSLLTLALPLCSDIRQTFDQLVPLFKLCSEISLLCRFRMDNTGVCKLCCP